MLPFEFEFMCTLFRTVVTAQYFPTNRIRIQIHILSFYWYVWNSVFDLIFTRYFISVKVADIKVVDKIRLMVSLELAKGFNIL